MIEVGSVGEWGKKGRKEGGVREKWIENVGRGRQMDR